MAAVEARALVFADIGKAVVSSVEVPQPGSGWLRLRTLACGLCWREVHVYNGKLRRPFPVIMGHEPVGIVEQIGESVTGFKVGDIVTAIGQESLADYCLVEAKYACQVSALAGPAYSLGEPAMCALAAVRQARPRAGDLVIVNGVGFMGQLLVQALLKSADVSVVAVDVRSEHLILAKSTGAQHCLNAKDLTPETIRRDHGRLADIVVEASGVPGTIWPATQCVRNGGKL